MRWERAIGSRLGKGLGIALAGIILLGLWQNLAQAIQSLCAIVKLEIKQEATLEREAFDARLAIKNGLADQPLQGLKVDVIIKDTQGNSADQLFFVKIANLSNTSAIDGTGAIQPAQEAVINWLIIPSTGAGGVNPAGLRYSVKADISYSLSGTPQKIETFEDFITVKPQPLLQLEYVLPFEVFADEPLTDEVEPIEPFPLGVRITNVGHGPARNFKIDSAQPKIIDNKQGLLIDFKLLGAFVGDQAIPNTLLIPFGDISASGVKQAAWIMSTSLSGRFIEFTGSFSHAAELGGSLTSLTESLATGTLIKDVLIDLPGRDNQFDFLVNTTTSRSTIELLVKAGQTPRPDIILESDQPEPIAVTNVESELVGSLSGPDPTLKLRFKETVSRWLWVYSVVPAPLKLEKPVTLLSVQRPDGKKINPRNAWISKHFDKDAVKFIYRVNILDFDVAPGDYILTFEPKAVDEPPGKVQDLAAQTGAQGGQIFLSWGAPGEDGNQGDILGGRYLIQFEERPDAVFNPGSAQVNFATATSPGRPEGFTTSDLIGNTTLFIHLWTQDAGGSLSEISNQTSAATLPNPPQDPKMVFVGASSITVTWIGGNNRLPILNQIHIDTDTEKPFLASSPLFEPLVQEFTFTGLAPETTFFVTGETTNPDTGARSHLMPLVSTITLPIPDTQPPRTVLVPGEPLFMAGPENLFNSALDTTTVSFPLTFVSPFSTMTLRSIDDLLDRGDEKGVGVAKIMASLSEVFVATFTNPAPRTGEAFVSSFTFLGIPDAVYTFRFFGEDVAGNTEKVSTKTIAIDSLPPLTRLITSKALFRENNALYATSKDTFGFVAIDNLSGVEAITFQIDENTPLVFTGQPISFMREGGFRLRFGAHDPLGNEELRQEVLIVVDNTAPTFSGVKPVTIEAEDRRNLISDLEIADGIVRLITKEEPDPLTQTIRLTGTLKGIMETPFLELPEINLVNNFNAIQDFKEGQIVHEFSMDGITFLPIEQFSKANVTARKIKFRSTLKRESLEKESPILDSFFFDLIRLVALSAPVIGPKSTESVTISFIASERLVSTPTVTINAGEAFDGNVSPSLSWKFSYQLSSGAPSGVFPVVIEGSDLASNVGIDTSAVLAQDFIAPEIVINRPKEGEKFKAIFSSITVDFVVTDNLDLGPTFFARLIEIENKGLLRGPTEFILTSNKQLIDPLNLDDGLWVLKVEAKDWVLNVSSKTSAAFEVIHDVLPPRTTVEVGDPNVIRDDQIYVSKQTLNFLSSIDDLIKAEDNKGYGVSFQVLSINGITQRFDNPEPKSGEFFASLIDLEKETDGLKNLLFYAADVLGNTEIEKSKTLALDNTVPITELFVSTPSYFTQDLRVVSTITPVGLVAVDPVINQVAVGLGTTTFRVISSTVTSPQDIPFGVFKTTFTLSEESYAIEFKSKDLLGNEEQAKSAKVLSDGTPPIIAISSPIAGDKYIATISSIPIAVTLTDNFDPNPQFTRLELVEIENRGLLRGPTVFAVHPGDKVDPFALDDGLWVLEAQAQDWVKNSTKTVSGVFEVIHDTQLPQTELVFTGPQFGQKPIFVSSETVLHLRSIDDLLEVGDRLGLGVSFTLFAFEKDVPNKFINPNPKPGVTFTTEPFAFTGIDEGLRIVSFESEDIVGNRENTNTAEIAIDNTSPITKLHLEGPIFSTGEFTFITSSTTISFTAIDGPGGE